MPPEAFHLLPWRLGWLYEYINGVVYPKPSAAMLIAESAVVRRNVPAEPPRRRPMESDAGDLTRLFIDAFRDTPEFYRWSKPDFRDQAEKRIGEYFGGKYGEPHPASLVAAGPDGLIGAALLVRKSDVPLLDILMVSSSSHRRGIATLLVQESMNALAAGGEEILRSSYMLANEPSRRWHETFGFAPLPDIDVTRHCIRNVGHQIRRAEQLSQEVDPGLRTEADHLQRQLDALQEREAREGFASVRPYYRLMVDSGRP